MRPKLLFVGDYGCSTGFERSSRYIVEALLPDYDVSVLALNFKGDFIPGKFPCPVYTCYPGGDVFGLGRMKEVLFNVKPELVMVQNDPWNFRQYLEQIGKKIPTIGIVAVDGKNCHGTHLNGLAHTIFWTEFAQKEAIRGGFKGSSSVVPLGVDLGTYYPQDKMEIRKRLGLKRVFEPSGLDENAFIVGAVGRNQFRKRHDLTIKYFAEWVKQCDVKNVGLWMHVASVEGDAHDLHNIARYYGVGDLLFLPEIDSYSGIPESLMSQFYSVFDVLLSTTVGEGWGLPAMEAMACGLPCILPDWSAYGEWAAPAAHLVSCTSTSVASNINTVGGIMDEVEAIDALDGMYTDSARRADHRARGLALAHNSAFRWERIGQQVLEVTNQVLGKEMVACPSK